MNPKWSIVIPTYNAGKYLNETIQSVLAVNYPLEEMEIIVVDNCSTDNTHEIVKSRGQGVVQLVVNEKNLGACGNFNRCIEISKGKYVHILNADDLVKPDYYIEMEHAFINNKVALVSCGTELIDEESKVTGHEPPIISMIKPSQNINDFIYDNPFRTPAISVMREAYDELGKFDTSLIFTCDWDMWLRIVYKKSGIYIDKELCSYRMHSSNETSNNILSGVYFEDMERLFKKFNKLGYKIDEDKANQRVKDSVLWYFYRFYFNKDIKRMQIMKETIMKYFSYKFYITRYLSLRIKTLI